MSLDVNWTTQKRLAFLEKGLALKHSFILKADKFWIFDWTIASPHAVAQSTTDIKMT